MNLTDLLRRPGALETAAGLMFGPRGRQAARVVRQVAEATLAEADPTPTTAPAAGVGTGTAFVPWFLGRDHGMYGILGAKGSGKTTLALTLAERIKARDGVPVIAVGMPGYDRPPWVEAIEPDENQDDLQNAVLILDDAGLYADRGSYTEELGDRLMGVHIRERHRRLRVLMIAQRGSAVNK